VKSFSADIFAVFDSVMARAGAGDSNVPATRYLTSEQKESRKVALRIDRAIRPLLADAVRKELELSGRPFERELKEMEDFLNNSMLLRRDSLAGSLGSEEDVDVLIGANDEGTGGNKPRLAQNGVDIEMKDVLDEPAIDLLDEDAPGEEVEDDSLLATTAAQEVKDSDMTDNEAVAEEDRLQQDLERQLISSANEQDKGHTNGLFTDGQLAASNPTPPTNASAEDVQFSATVQKPGNQPAPPSPPPSHGDDPLAPLSHGGIPWYLEPFDPHGTTIYEERWTGREVLRGMSEELSELDDEELRELVGEKESNGTLEKVANGTLSGKQASQRLKNRRRNRQYG
jgi:NuA3 HAT complex component NTO1